MTELTGVIPPATTPFDSAGDIDFSAAGRQIETVVGLGYRFVE